VNAAKLRKFIPIAGFASACFLSLCPAYGQETWGTAGASSWGAGSTSGATSTAQAAQSGGNASWIAGRGSVESRSQKGGVWHAGSALVPVASNLPGSSAAKSAVEASQSPRPVASKATPPAVGHNPHAVGKAQIPHLSGGHSSSANAHSSIGRHVGGGSSSHGTQFRFSRSMNASTAATNASGTRSKSGAGSGMDSLHGSENAVKAAENPSVSDSLKNDAETGIGGVEH
jgi:hypothetical protein